MADAAPPAALGNWALFLDIDGTLLELAATPDGVAVPEGLPALLDRLSGRLTGALALVSGRSLAGIDRLLPGGRDAAGTHGVEWRQAGQARTLAESWPAELDAAVAAAAAQLPFLRVERKDHSIALHYRAAPDQGAAVRALAASVAGAAPRPFDLLDGKAVVEIIPAGAGKGAAIERFMANPPYAGRRPVFVGDDVTDEHGFAAVNRLGGISIHVGTNPATAARWRLDSPVAVRAWLSTLVR